MIPHHIYLKLLKLDGEKEQNKDILYKCNTCNGSGIRPGFSKTRILVFNKNMFCKDCDGIGCLYFFELMKYEEYFDENNFHC